MEEVGTEGEESGWKEEKEEGREREIKGDGQEGREGGMLKERKKTESERVS